MKLTLERSAQRRTKPSTTRRQVEEIVARGLAGGRGKKFELITRIPAIIEPKDAGDHFEYSLELEFRYLGKIADQAESQFIAVRDAIAKAAPSKGKWRVQGHVVASQADALRATATRLNFDAPVADITIDKGRHFDHLFGLDAQIDVILSAMRTAKETSYRKRFHVVLHGKPGCGKSDILNGLKEMVGPEGYMEFDGTQTTSAGAIGTLASAEVLPPLLMIEEIEKVQDNIFLWLLAALDIRGEIRKLTHWSLSHRKVPFVCLATVNDLDLFNSRHEGAMSSRFAHKLYCPRPSPEILRRILRREVRDIKGDERWIEPALAYCLEHEKTSDPRRIVAVCLTGRDDLLSGAFQKKLHACRHVKEDTP